MLTRHLSIPLAFALVLGVCATARSADGAPARAPETAAVAVVPPATTAAPAAASSTATAAATDKAVAPAATDKAVAPAAAASGAEAASAPAAAASAPVAASLDGRIQDAKLDIIKLNRDLLVLEEELLFPANTQVAVFVSMDVGKMFDLDSVQVKLDDKLVASYLYTPLEVKALHRGGVQRVFLGNLKAGDHELVALFTGKGPHDRDYKRGTTLKFEKGTEAKYIELRIRDSEGRLQPEFDVKTWQ